MKRYQKIIIVAVVLLWRLHAGAQIITGIVCNKDDKKPVSGVYVYLDGTSINTTTNVSGKFELKSNSVLNTRLVLQHLSYETVIINQPFEGIPDTLYLETRIQSLREVIITGDPFTRKQKMKAFREQFLGMTKAGKSCVILNEDDIQLYVDLQTRRLIATSEKPIMVVNDFLGYRVYYTLIDFWVQYGSSVISLDNDWVQSSHFSVVSSFTDTALDSKSIKKRRDNIYELSSNNFFKNFANGTLKENKFSMYNKSLSIDYKQYFTTTDTLSKKMITINPDTDINTFKDFYTGPKLFGRVSVLFNKKYQSDVYFTTDTFMVDRHGNIDKINMIYFVGQMSENRAGDMLPIDYEPTN